MHCPSCGQQQVSIETKFCSRCGMPLVTVAQVLTHGGFLPQLAELQKKKTFFTRQNGMKFSLIWCFFFLLIMAPLWGIIGVEELSGVSAIMGIFGGLLMLISSLMFLPKATFQMDMSQMPASQSPYGLPGQNINAALPPQQSIPASVYTAPNAGSWRDTNDLQPTSVTESTTRLLSKDEQ